MKIKKSVIVPLIISGALTAVIALVMNLYLIPAIEKAAGGLRCFDMRFGYTYDAARQFLDSITVEGRHIYGNIQLPLDFVYPVAYGSFFILLIYVLTRKKTPLMILPGLLMCFDYTENVCISLMLRNDALSETLVRVASCATVVKTVLMYGCFIVLIILLIRWFIKRKQTH